MGAAIGLRDDFDGAVLRRLARTTKSANQGRRLLALAEIYDGGSRSAAARIGGVGMQIVRDWVVRFNARGPDGLLDGKAPGKCSVLNDAQRRALVEIVESGPIPAIHGVAGLVLPFCNTQTMSLHLAEISLAIAPGAHAAVLMAQAGWHMTDKLEVPGNISIIALPPKCPELNALLSKVEGPVENVWQFMRDNWLSNRIFKSCDDILDHCCFAWNRLADQPWRIMSIGLRQWAHG